MWKEDNLLFILKKIGVLVTQLWAQNPLTRIILTLW